MREKSALISLLQNCCIFPSGEKEAGNICAILRQDSSIDWNALALLAAEHRVVPQLYLNLASLEASSKISIPPEVLALLKILYNKQVVHSFKLSDLLARTLHRFGEAGIRAILIKGAATTAYGYRFPNIRDMLDADLLLSDEDSLAKAKQILLDLGLHAGKVSHFQFGKAKSGFKFDYLHGNGPLGIDLHLAIGEGGYGYISGAEELREPVEMSVGSTRALVSCPEDTLLITCANSLGNGKLVLRDLVDIVTVLSQNTLDWTYTVERAKSLGLTFPLYSQLLLATSLMNVRAELEEEAALQKLSSALPAKFKGCVLDGSEFDSPLASVSLRFYRDNYFLPTHVGSTYPVRRLAARAKETIRLWSYQGNGFEGMSAFANRRSKDMIKKAAERLSSFN